MSLLDTASLIVTPNGYEEGKPYSVIPSDGSGDLSVTRATTATRVNSQGLVELVPYNLLSYSEQFDNADWQKRNNIAITANATTAPNGTLTADKMYLSNNLLADYGIFQILPSKNYTLSVYAKKAEIGYLYLGYNNDTAADGVFYNLNNGTISSNTSSYTASITDEGNGWFRCSVTLPTLAYAFISPSTNGTSFIVTGQLNNGLYIWGAQLVEGSVAKDYQKTETRLNIPRLDYSNGTCPSILVEPQRTNLLTWSSSFDNVDWGKLNTTISANSAISPSGIQDADTLTASGGTALHTCFWPTSLFGANHTISVYAKKNTNNFLQIYTDFVNTDYANFDLNNGVVGSVGSTVISSSIESVGDGWYRCSFVTGASASQYVNFSIISSATSPRTESNALTTSVFIWGAQLEAGSYATSYIPTTSASVTRNADVISKTGISSLIGQTEGTLFVEFYNYANNSTIQGTPLAISNGGFYGNAVYFEQYLGSWYCAIWNGTSQQFLGNAGVLSEGWHKLAVAYKANDIAYYVDGNQIAVDTSATIPTCDRVDIGAIGTSTNPEQLGVKAAVLWKTRLTNTQLAQLTTI